LLFALARSAEVMALPVLLKVKVVSLGLLLLCGVKYI